MRRIPSDGLSTLPTERILETMPLYEYQCEACGCCFEMLVFASDRDPVACPGCSDTRVKRLMSTAVCCSSGNSSQRPKGGAGFS